MKQTSNTSLRGMSAMNDEAIQCKGKTNNKSGLLRRSAIAMTEKTL
jgi:hypothetical protein